MNKIGDCMGGGYAGGGKCRRLKQIRDGVEGKTAEWQIIKYLRGLYNPSYVWCESIPGISAKKQRNVYNLDPAQSKGKRMRFDRKRFSANADSVCCKLLPESHRKLLDGKEVIDGQIEYSVDGEEYYLYPVLPEWCID